MHTQPLAANPRYPRTRRLLNRCAWAMAQWAQRARTRRQLAQLTPQQLADAGISHCDRIIELSKPFWRE